MWKRKVKWENGIKYYQDRPNGEWNAYTFEMYKQDLINAEKEIEALTQAKNCLSSNGIVSELPFSMEDVMLYYDKSKFIFNSPISDILNSMLNQP